MKKNEDRKLKSSSRSLRDMLSFNTKKKEIRSIRPFVNGVNKLKRTYSREKDMLRVQVRRAIEEKDYTVLRKCVNDIHKDGVDQLEQEYEMAIQTLARHDHLISMQEITIRSLIHAIEEADRQLLKSAIIQAEDTRLKPETCKELSDAKEAHQDSFSPWNVQNERCANLLRQGIESSTTNSVVRSVLDLLGRLTREGRRSPELIRDSEFETRHMSLNIRVKKRKRLMQLAAYVLKLRFGSKIVKNRSAKFLKNGLLFG